jgi:hypothetical protein
MKYKYYLRDTKSPRNLEILLKSLAYSSTCLFILQLVYSSNMYKIDRNSESTVMEASWLSGDVTNHIICLFFFLSPSLSFSCLRRHVYCFSFIHFYIKKKLKNFSYSMDFIFTTCRLNLVAFFNFFMISFSFTFILVSFSFFYSFITSFTSPLSFLFTFFLLPFFFLLFSFFFLCFFFLICPFPL